MDVRIQGSAPTEPFLGAADLFETEHDLRLPVRVQVRENPDERTWTAHYDSYHVLNISRQAATSAMARELSLHEYAHMRRYEQSHPSHLQSTAEALVLALAGRSIERRQVAHCHQIANHMKDIYADDITISVAPADKLVAFLESSLASALADRPTERPATYQRLTPAADPEITAVNAAFALALCERHDLVGTDHRLYDLAHAAGNDAPRIGLDGFKSQFRSLAADPSASQYRKALVDVTRRYALRSGRAAD
jgi:hypothetical protein